MSLALTNLSWWLWSGKQNIPKLQNGSSSLNSTAELYLPEIDTLRFPVIVGGRPSTSQRLKRKLRTRQEQKIDREHDVVLVSSDGGCVSDSDSDASDWSIGWSEPHAPGFQTDDETDGGFGVLVPCYNQSRKNEAARMNKITVTDRNPPGRHSGHESQKYMEQWLSSLQNI